MSERAWSQSSDTFRPVSTVSISPVLKPGIYIPGVDLGGHFLTKYHEKYVFPYKVYGVNRTFIDRVDLTYQKTTGNLGVLMNGVKGTGKSVTSEQICNRFMEMHNMPVILINQRINGLIEFLASIDQDIVVFVDEYEKVFVNEDGRANSTEILTLMDGALKSEHRRLFLFTTNNKRIDDNLLERPGRIRYVKEFVDLDRTTIEELVDDLLTNKERREACVEYISKLQKITIDIVKAVITEVNIHDENPDAFADIFNANELKERHSIYKGKLTEAEMATAIPFIFDVERFSPPILNAPKHFHEQWIDSEEDVYANHQDLGEFISFENNILTTKIYDEDKDGNNIEILKQYTIESKVPYHSSYSSYEF
jgi:DNA-directed RNA polymerase subunit F